TVTGVQTCALPILDSGYPGVDVQPRDRELGDEAVPAEQLQAFVDDLALHFGREQLHPRRVSNTQFTCVMDLDRGIYQSLPSRDGGVAVGENELGVLEVSQPTVEDHAVAHIVGGESHGSDGRCLGPDRDGETFLREVTHQVVKGYAFAS